MTRVAPAAQAVLDQASRLRPNRSTASDGTIGDHAHRMRVFDHNPDRRGVVHAADLTHDPKHGMDAHGWARWIAGRDRRIKYLISNRQIWEPGRGWYRYSGQNPHEKHVHVSVLPQYENDTSPWFNGWLTPPPTNLVKPPPPAPSTPARPNLAFGESSRGVAIWQWEAAVVTNGNATFPGETGPGDNGTYGLHTAQSVVNLGRITGNNWNGVLIGADQWRVLDMLYAAKGLTPVMS